MEYKDIDRVNGEITMLNLKGKNYAMVPERVNAFRKLYPEGFIITEIIDKVDFEAEILIKEIVGQSWRR